MDDDTTRGFGLKCPECGEDSAIELDLNDLRYEVQCANCQAEFHPRAAARDFAEQAARWAAVVRWIDAAMTFLMPPGEGDAT